MDETTPVDNAAAARAARTETFVHVLVVDDDPQARDLLRYALPEQFSRHADFVSADSLNRAFKILKYRPIDVILLDLGLPDSEGVQTLVRLQNFMRTEGLDIPVIVLTGRDESHLGGELIRAGAELYLVKGKIDSRQVYEACANVALGRRYHVRIDPSSAKVVASARSAGEELRKVTESMPPPSPREHARDVVLSEVLQIGLQTLAKQAETASSVAAVVVRIDEHERRLARVETDVERLDEVVDANDAARQDSMSQVEIKRFGVEEKRIETDHAYKMERLKHVAKVAGAVLLAVLGSGGLLWQIFGAG